MTTEKTNRELVSAGFTFAKQISGLTPVNEIVKMIGDLATRLDVVSVRSNALAAERDKAINSHRNHAARLIDERGQLRQRLEAAEAQVKELTADLDKESEIRHRIHEELNAIKGEQQPVAYMHRSGQVVNREECGDDKIFSICCKVETPLYIHPSSSGADDYHMQRHEFAAMVNELRSLPNIQSKRELIVKTLSTFNISPVAPAPGGDHG